MPEDPGRILSRVNHLRPGESSQDLYDQWASDYDQHLLEDFGYLSPLVAARALAEEIDQRDGEIIDFGCGTGLVGMALRQQGFDTVDGVDISTGMLERAREKNAYRELIQADLTQALEIETGRYQAGFCVGSMGAGHVGAQHCSELLRCIAPGGLFIICINAMHYAPEGFQQSFSSMQDDGLWRIKQLSEFNYMSQLHRPGWLLLAEKL